MSRRCINNLTGMVVLGLATVLAACGTPGPTRSAAVETVDSTIDDDAELAYARAVDAMRAERWLEAELALEQFAAAHPAYPGALVNLAIVYRQDGRAEDATAMLQRALTIEPGHPEANNMLGILYREQGRFGDAEQAYRQAIATDADYALAHYNLAVLLDVYLQRGAEALEHYQRYQLLLAEPDQAVGRWIIDLRRRFGITDESARVAQGDGL